MGILRRSSGPVSEFKVEYLAGSKEAVFGPGQVLQGIIIAQCTQLMIEAKSSLEFDGPWTLKKWE